MCYSLRASEDDIEKKACAMLMDYGVSPFQVSQAITVGKQKHLRPEEAAADLGFISDENAHQIKISSNSSKSCACRLLKAATDQTKKVASGLADLASMTARLREKLESMHHGSGPGA